MVEEDERDLLSLCILSVLVTLGMEYYLYGDLVEVFYGPTGIQRYHSDSFNPLFLALLASWSVLVLQVNSRDGSILKLLLAHDCIVGRCSYNIFAR